MKSETKQIPCSYKDCSQRRPHFTSMETTREHRMVEVSIGHEEPAYCSIECAAYDGYFNDDKNKKED